MKARTFVSAAIACLLALAPSAYSADSTDVLLGAMQAELDRSMQRLRLDDLESPYFLSYLVKEDRVFAAAGRFGALISEGGGTHRSLYVELRVGDYDFDNSGRGGFEFSFDPLANSPDLFRYVQAPIEDDPEALRTQLWLLTDAKYKQALSAFQAKKGRQVYLVDEPDRPPDFSREEPVRFRGPALEWSPDEGFWKGVIRDESAFLRDTKHLTDSTVQVQFDQERKYLVNSEGSEIYADELYFTLVASAETRAPDGMMLTDSYTCYARSPEGVPDAGTIHAGIVAMVQNLQVLRDAEPIEPISVPAILGPSVSGVFFHEAIGHRLEGERQKNPEEGQTFTGKVGQKILPDFLTVVDDPTIPRHEGTYLNGHYAVDDEGIPSQRVVLVDKGVLRSFLMSRAPIKGFVHSNGHGRNATYEDPMGRMGSLFVESDRELTAKKLKAKLLEEVRRQKKPFGLIVRRSVGGETQTANFDFQAFRNRPTLIYRVDAETGEETLVRGAEIVGTPLVSINKILATGDDYAVFNGFCGAESGYVPVSSITPSCLVSEMELQKIADQPQRPPILGPPTPRETR